MAFHPLTYIGLLFILSQLGGRIAERFHVPRVLGYLLVGIIFGPSVLGVFPAKVITGELEIITEIALAIIAFSIGGALEIEKLRSLKWPLLWITFLQAFAAALFVLILMSIFLPWLVPPGEVKGGFLNGYLPIALVIGALSAATAPAAVLSIIREYKAKGQFTSVLLGVIALDDALTMIFFAFAITIGKSLMGGGAADLSGALLESLGTIALEMSIGAIIGMTLSWIIPFFGSRKALLGLTIGAIFLSGGIAVSLDLSPLLDTMTLGFVLINFGGGKKKFEAFEVIEHIEESVFGIFFALAGAHLQLAMLSKAFWLIILLTGGRFAGKYLGSMAGAHITNAPATVKRYLGIALLPAAGVTIGLMLEANAVYSPTHPKLCETMVSAVVGATLINELLTPFLVRYSLFRAGEAQPEHT